MSSVTQGPAPLPAPAPAPGPAANAKPARRPRASLGRRPDFMAGILRPFAFRFQQVFLFGDVRPLRYREPPVRCLRRRRGSLYRSRGYRLGRLAQRRYCPDDHRRPGHAGNLRRPDHRRDLDSDCRARRPARHCREPGRATGRGRHSPLHDRSALPPVSMRWRGTASPNGKSPKSAAWYRRWRPTWRDRTRSSRRVSR